MDDTAPDPLAAYLAEVKERADYSARYEMWEPDYLPRLLAAVEVPLRLHVPARDPAHCDQCGQPWPCYEYEHITKALLGEEGT